MSEVGRRGRTATAVRMTRTDIGRARCGGFSYLWLLFLVALMGVGLSVAVEIDSVAAQRERERELLAVGRQFRFAIGRYYETQLTGGQREYPASLEDLLRDNRAPGVRRYLRKIFVDPMTGKAEWGFVRAGGRIVGVHSLSEREPIKQDGFEPEDMGFRGKKHVKEWVFTYPPELIVQGDGEIVLPVMEPLKQQGNHESNGISGQEAQTGVLAVDSTARFIGDGFTAR